MKKKNEYIKSIIVLGSICLAVAVLLAAVNFVTAPIIADNAAHAVQESLGAVLDGAGEFEEVELPKGSPETVQAVYKDKNGNGYAIALATTSSYSGSPMTFTLGIGTDGKIAGVKITNYAETKDFGAAYPETYIGADSTLSGIDLVSGVTYSSTAFKNAVSDAFFVLVAMGEVGEGEKTVQQTVLDMLPDILPGAVDGKGNPKVVEMSASDAYNFGYKASNGSGCVFCIGEVGEERILTVSITGGVAAYGLHGETTVEFTEDEYKALMEAAEFFTDKADSAAAEIMGDKKYDRITLPDQFGTIMGAYKDESGNYLFISSPYGYNKPMTIAVAIAADGKIIQLKNVSEFIQESDHYTYYTLDEGKYCWGFKGLDEDSYTDEVSLITGATVTSKAVNTATLDAFSAYSAAEGSER